MAKTSTAKKGTSKASETFTAEEKAAMREAAKERKKGGADGESDVLAKIAEMSPGDRKMAKRIHALVKANAPDLAPRTWYGMPAYTKGGDVLCHFQPAEKFKTRYATLGFSDKAKLDEGAMWPVGFALAELTDDVEARIAELVKRAAAD
jgi:uncharacterized protein YdhG (YjbR/CyaY superfamily)